MTSRVLIVLPGIGTLSLTRAAYKAALLKPAVDDRTIDKGPPAALPRIDPNRRYCVTDAARYLELSPRMVNRRFREKKIKRTKDGNRTYVKGSELLRYLRRN